LSRTIHASSTTASLSAPQSEIGQRQPGDASSPRYSNVSSPRGSPQTESPSTAPSPTPSRQNSSDAGTDEHGADGTEDGDGDQASVGRLSSMSLMAAVTANGRNALYSSLRY
jgi:serine/threonine-protein phosphatase 4 regulatory subunit 1